MSVDEQGRAYTQTPGQRIEGSDRKKLRGVTCARRIKKGG